MRDSRCVLLLLLLLQSVVAVHMEQQGCVLQQSTSAHL